MIYANVPILVITHFEWDDWPAFVFDMMEPERPKVDRVVLAFLKSEALHPADFTITRRSVLMVEDRRTLLHIELEDAAFGSRGDRQRCNYNNDRLAQKISSC